MNKRSAWPYAIVAAGVIAGGVLGIQSRSAHAVPSDAVTKTVTVDGFGGPMTVEVTATQDKIYAVNITENSETDGIGSNAVSQLPGAMVSGNTVAVDSVSGATISSEAIKKAVSQALTEAGYDAAKFGGVVE